MKILSFSAVEILPALLNKTKTQSIRPLFGKSIGRKHAQFATEYVGKLHETQKKSRFQVGEKIKLMWKQRSKAKYFCEGCGYPTHTCKGNILRTLNTFQKVLGEGIINQIFEIEMCIGNDAPLVTGYSLKQTEELARFDGFPKGNEIPYKSFWDYFHKHYDLFFPKRFAVYRWEWI